MKNNLSDYNNFLTKFVTNKKQTDDTKPVTIPSIDRWQNSNASKNTNENLIINEIAKKFNNHNKFGINEINKSKPSMYGVNTNTGNPYLALSDMPIEPRVIAHELVHANDHQIDSLNPKVWDNLEELYSLVGKDKFDNSLQALQNKINPGGDFRSSYPLNRKYFDEHVDYWNKLYPNDEIETEKKANTGGNQWTKEMFKPIRKIANSSIQEEGHGMVTNPSFLAGFASEFPAFISERLTDQWKTGENGGTKGKPIRALDFPEQQFLYKTLTNMGDAYPQTEYPTINRFINERRRSIERTSTWGNKAESPRPNSPQTMGDGVNTSRLEYTPSQAKMLNQILPKGFSLQMLNQEVQPSDDPYSQEGSREWDSKKSNPSLQQVPNPLMYPKPQHNTFSTMSGGYPSMGTNQFMTQNQPNLNQGLQSWVSGNYGQGATLSGTNPFRQMTMSNQYGSQFGSDLPQSFNQGSQQLGTSGQEPNPLLQRMGTQPQQNPIVIILRKTDRGYALDN